MKRLFFFLFLVSQVSNNISAQETSGGSKKIENINELLTDTAAGAVSASSMLGISGDAVTAVENTKTLVVAIKGLGTAGDQVALSFTPARSSFFPMSLSKYAGDNAFGYRLLGNTSISFAQGTSKIGGTDVERQAFGLETSFTLRKSDDPLIAVHEGCTWVAPIAAPKNDNDTEKPTDYSASNKSYIDCVTNKEAELAKKWNISRFSASVGSGTVKPDGTPSTQLGQIFAASLIYGFDNVGSQALKEGGAIAITLKHGRNEPVLSELVKGNIVRKNSNLAAVRLSGGSENFRTLFEVSNAREKDVTASQVVFKHALGIDLKLSEGAWLNIRTGKRNKITGIGEEAATLLDFSISPKSDIL